MEWMQDNHVRNDNDDNNETKAIIILYTQIFFFVKCYFYIYFGKNIEVPIFCSEL